jgi:predicted dehydrogenase
MKGLNVIKSHVIMWGVNYINTKERITLERRPFSIIGCQHAHIQVFIEEMLHLGHRCAGIFDDQKESKLAAVLSHKYDIPLLSNIEDALKPEIEIVGCAAINHRKIDVIELCEQRNKHIMLDKPMVTDRHGLTRLEAVMERGSIQIGMLLTERFHPAIYTLKQQIDKGDLGELVSIAMRKPHRLSVNNRPEWFFRREQSGGIINDLLIHDFDLLRWFTESEVITAEGYMRKQILNEYPTFYDSAQLLVQMESGLVAQLYADWHTPDKSWTWGDCRIFVAGTKGSAELRLLGDPLVSQTSMMLKVTGEESLHAVMLLNPPCGIMQDFLHRIEGKHAILTGKDVLNASKAAVEADENVKMRM